MSRNEDGGVLWHETMQTVLLEMLSWNKVTAYK